MKCSFCGNELEPGAGFCPNCGTIISLDNDFVSPKTNAETPPAAPVLEQPQPDLPPQPVFSPQPEAPAASMEPLHGMPAYVSPTFEAYEPAQLAENEATPYDPEADDDDPFRELHPDLDETPPPAPLVIPAEAQISDTQPVALEGTIPVYEPTEEGGFSEEDVAEEAGDDMYVTGGSGKKGKITAAVVALLLVAGAVGAWYYVKTQNPFFRPAPPETETQSTPLVPQSSTTEAPSLSDEDTTDDTDLTDDTDDTDDATTDDVTQDTADDTTANSTEAPGSDDQTVPSGDDNELTAPDESTAAPSATAPTTAAPSTTARPTTTRPTTTAPRTTARPTTTAPRTTARPTTTAPTTRAANTLQRPTSTFAARTMYVSEDGVALRYAPNSGSGNQVSLSVGADVRVTAEENGFYYVYSNRYGISGWVSKRYLGSSRPVAQTQQTVAGVVSPDVTVDGGTKTVNSGGTGLNLRKGPGTNYDVIRSIGDGYPVAVKGKSSSVSGWVYVTDITRGISGWVSAAYLN